MIHAHRLPARILYACVLTFAAAFSFPGFAVAQVETASGGGCGSKKAAGLSTSGQHASKFATNIRICRAGARLTISCLASIFRRRRIFLSASKPRSFLRIPVRPGNDGESGIGDLLFRGSYRVAHGPGYAIVAGSEVILNSASKDSLGMGKNVIAPLVFVSIDVPQCNSVVFPFLQHYITVGGDDARRDVHYTSLKAPFLTRWSNLVLYDSGTASCGRPRARGQGRHDTGGRGSAVSSIATWQSGGVPVSACSATTCRRSTTGNSKSACASS